MRMSCSFQHRLELRCETRLALEQSFQVVGGATQSIFPEVDALLVGSTAEYQHALLYVAARKRMSDYRSMVDFLFCELHPKWKLSCRSFYQGAGSQLRELIDEDERVSYNTRMLKALEVALQLHNEKRCESWGWYVQQVEAACAA